MPRRHPRRLGAVGRRGQGKIVDLLAERSDVIVRFHGGNNAGHAVVVSGEGGTSSGAIGVLHHGRCVIGNGVVVVLWCCSKKSMGSILQVFYAAMRICASSRRMILPYQSGDLARGAFAGPSKIGTTDVASARPTKTRWRASSSHRGSLEERTFRELFARPPGRRTPTCVPCSGEEPLDFDRIFAPYL
jgi:adenylosuccinate synthase